MSNKEAVRRLLLLLGKYKKTIVVIVGCLLVSTGLNLCVPLISRRIMDDGFIGGNKKLLIELVLVSMVIYTINSLIDLIKEKKRVDISAKIQYFLSEQSFSHLMKLRVNYFNNTNYAETLNNINMDINQMTSVADSSVFFVITQAFSMTGGIIGLFIIDFRMTILVLLFIPIKCVVMKYFAKKQKQIMDEFIKKNQKYAKWFGDTVGGVREVKLFNILDRKHEEFDQNQKDIIEKQKQMNMLGQWNTITDSLMVQFLSTLLYILGANLVFDLQLSVGSVFAFITYSSYVTGPISAILNIGYLLSGIIPSTKRYYAFMDLEEETDNGETAALCPDDLKLQQVSFAYEKEIKKNLRVDTLSYKTISANKETAHKEWVVVDATDQVVGRLGSKVAKLLRGKYKPDFTPHADCGDNVIIINADKVKFTGNKWNDKVYLRYTGYPGGQREMTPAQLMKKPNGEEKLLKRVVKGMLPKNRLGAQLLGNLYVYAGSEHKHEAQTPKSIDINSLK